MYEKIYEKILQDFFSRGIKFVLEDVLINDNMNLIKTARNR